MEAIKLFTADQISFMKELGIHVNFSAPTVDEIEQIEDSVSWHLQKYGFDENYFPNADGKMCEAILTELATM